MAKVFLDTNTLIDLVEARAEISPEELDDYELFISPLSIHILMYITKKTVPYKKLYVALDSFVCIPFTAPISYKSLEGPTSDFEDNVQLHSAAEAVCDFFVTNDKQLLSMKFFGKTKIVSTLR